MTEEEKELVCFTITGKRKYVNDPINFCINPPNPEVKYVIVTCSATISIYANIEDIPVIFEQLKIKDCHLLD